MDVRTELGAVPISILQSCWYHVRDQSATNSRITATHAARNIPQIPRANKVTLISDDEKIRSNMLIKLRRFGPVRDSTFTFVRFFNPFGCFVLCRAQP